jgi:hypothetical protein
MEKGMQNKCSHPFKNLMKLARNMKNNQFDMFYLQMGTQDYT